MAFELPTADEVQAWRLRTVQGMDDGEIADLLDIRRETANRRVNAFLRKKAALVRAFPELNPATLMRLLTGESDVVVGPAAAAAHEAASRA